MKKQFDDYVLLHNGRHLGSLWLGPDHLLIIEKSSFFGSIRENYRRLDYDGIQGIFTARSSKSKTTTVVLSVIAALFAAFAAWMASDESWGGVWIFGLMAFFMLIVLTVHLVRGPSAGLIVRTAVRAWQLAPVDRLKVAGKVFDALAARCHEIQGGELTNVPDDMSAPSPVAQVDPFVPLQPPPMPVHLVRVEEDLIPPHPTILWGYATLGVAGALVAGELFLNHIAYTLFMIAVLLASFGLLFIGISRRGGVSSTGSKANFIVSVILLSLLMTMGYLLSLFGSFSDYSESSALDYLGFARHLAAFPDQGTSDVLQTFVLAAATGCLACSVIGLLIASKRKNMLAEQPPGTEAADDS